MSSLLYSGGRFRFATAENLKMKFWCFPAAELPFGCAGRPQTPWDLTQMNPLLPADSTPHTTHHSLLTNSGTETPTPDSACFFSLDPSTSQIEWSRNPSRQQLLSAKWMVIGTFFPTRESQKLCRALTLQPNKCIIFTVQWKKLQYCTLKNRWIW